jgi:hypothetical protein
VTTPRNIAVFTGTRRRRSSSPRWWPRCAADLRVEAPGQSEKIAMIGALDFVSRKLIVATSRTKRGSDDIALLERLGRIHGPNIDDVRPGLERKPTAIVLDNEPVHTSRATRDALAARQDMRRRIDTAKDTL